MKLQSSMTQSDALIHAAKGAAERAPVALPVGADSTVQVLSLDVFDTMLVRECGAPEAMFLWLGRRLHRKRLIDCSPEVFARTRHRVELQVLAREDGLDSRVTLDTIYIDLAQVFALDESRAQAILAEELALEEAVLRPTRQGKALLEMARNDGLAVVFTSDTYFSSSFLEKQLRKHDLWPAGARCFASCDFAASKASGQLFQRLAEELGVEQSRILHVGDHPLSDVVSARRCGLQARPLPEGRLNRFEKQLVDARWETGGFSAAFAGASRAARMNLQTTDSRARALCEVAAGVGGPFMASYVLWLLGRAERLQLKRLYFVARDGQVLAEAARILARRLDLDVEIRYLYASRRSVNLAAVYDTSLLDLEWAFRDGTHLKLGKLLGRLGLTVEAIVDDLNSLGLPGLDETTRVTPEILQHIRSAAESGCLRDKVLAAATENRRLVIAYLQQEGLLDDERIGVVDLGGVGSQARAMHQLCVRNGQSRPRMFFVGLDRYLTSELAEAARQESWLDDAECFLYNEHRGYGIRPFRGLFTCFHLFCAADHGTVLGYEQRSGHVLPVLEGEDKSHLREWGLPTVRKTLMDFMEHVVLDDDLVDAHACMREMACSVLLSFMRSPTTDEAHAWGSFPFEGAEVSGVTVKRLAPPYRWGSVLRGLMDGSFVSGVFGWNAWHEGSVAVTAAPLRQTLGAGEKCVKALKSSQSPWVRRGLSLAKRMKRAIRRSR